MNKIHIYRKDGNAVYNSMARSEMHTETVGVITGRVVTSTSTKDIKDYLRNSYNTNIAELDILVDTTQTKLRKYLYFGCMNNFGLSNRLKRVIL
jgi:hypothetical protein